MGSQVSEVVKSNDQELEFCTVRPEEVPPVPENKFLKRRTDGPANILVERKRSKSRESHRDAAGRKVKGRGVLRYSGKNRSRSRTPPLWRRVANERRNLPDREKNFRNYENFVREKREQRPNSPRRKRSKSPDQPNNRKSKSLSPKVDKSRERSRDRKRSTSCQRAKEDNGKNGRNKFGEEEKVRKRSKSREEKRPSMSRNSSREKYSRRSRRKRSQLREKSSSGSRSSRGHSKNKSSRRHRSRSRD